MNFEKIIKESKLKDFVTLKKEVSQIMLENNYESTIFTSFKFKGFYRARNHNHLDGKLNENGILHKFINESEFWNVPEKYAEIGRCNNKEESIFYCANDIITAILEVKPKVEDFVTVSNFKNSFPLNEFRIRPVSIRSLSIIQDLKKELLKSYVFNQKNLKVEDFLDLLFCDNNESNYKLSVAVSHLFFTETINAKSEMLQTDGLIYPSIIRNKSSYCFALKPCVAKFYFEISYIQTFEILEVNENSLKVKLVRNGQTQFHKIYPAVDLFDIFWMKPSKEEIVILKY